MKLNSTLKNGLLILRPLQFLIFILVQTALEQLAKSIIEFPQLRSLDYQNSYFEKALSEFTSKDESNEMISSLNINGKIKKFPEKLDVPIFLGDIRYRWNSSRKAYVSYGDIGIANINKKTSNEIC